LSCDFVKSSNFYKRLQKNCKIDYIIKEYKARGQAFLKGGSNITVLAFYVTWLRALAWL
jgi:hypothetical protein